LHLPDTNLFTAQNATVSRRKALLSSPHDASSLPHRSPARHAKSAGATVRHLLPPTPRAATSPSPCRLKAQSSEQNPDRNDHAHREYRPASCPASSLRLTYAWHTDSAMPASCEEPRFDIVHPPECVCRCLRQQRRGRILNRKIRHLVCLAPILLRQPARRCGMEVMGQSRAVPSILPDTSVLPSGKKATAKTLLVCPRSTRSCRKFCASQI